MARNGGLPQGNFWFAEYDEAGGVGGSHWTPCLQMEGVAFTGDSWFATQKDCEEFILEEILGAAAYFEKVPAPMFMQPEVMSEADAAELKRRFLAAQNSGAPVQLPPARDNGPDDPRPQEVRSGRQQ